MIRRQIPYDKTIDAGTLHELIVNVLGPVTTKFNSNNILEIDANPTSSQLQQIKTAVVSELQSNDGL